MPNLVVSSGSVDWVKAVSPALGGVLMIVAAFIYFFYVLRMAIFPPSDLFFYREALVSSSEQLLVGISGLLAFASGLMAGIASLMRRHFWLAVVRGGFSVITGFWVLLANSRLPGLTHLLRNLPILGYLVTLPFALEVLGLMVIATSRKSFL